MSQRQLRVAIGPKHNYLLNKRLKGARASQRQRRPGRLEAEQGCRSALSDSPVLEVTPLINERLQRHETDAAFRAAGDAEDLGENITRDDPADCAQVEAVHCGCSAHDQNATVPQPVATRRQVRRPRYMGCLKSRRRLVGIPPHEIEGLYAKLIAGSVFLIPSLCGAPYFDEVGIGAPQDRHDALSAAGSGWSLIEVTTPRTRPAGMSRVRWVLFAAMARFELPEDVYLRVPRVQPARPAQSLLVRLASRFREHRTAQ